MMRRVRLGWALVVLSSGAAVSYGCASKLDQAAEAEHAGDDREAEAQYREVMDRGGSDAQSARDSLADLLVARGERLAKQDPVEAEKVFREVLDLKPSSNKGLLGVARALLKQDKQAEAMELLSEQRGCNGCGRLLAVLLVERGEKRLRNKQWGEARSDFERALEMMPDPMAALGIVSTYEAGGASALAVEAMERAVPLIKDNSKDAQQRFVALRRKLIMAAAKTGDISTVNRYLAMTPPGAGGDEWFALQLDLSRERFRRGDRNFAIERLAELLKQSSQDMAPSRRTEIEKFVVSMYSARAAQHLRDGEIAKAENDLTYALRIDPGNWTVKLQRVLAVVALGKLTHSFRMLKKIPKGTEGRKQVLAILWSLRVNEQLAEGNFDEARKALAKAQKANAEMPEVHVAAAQLLSLTPVEGLPGKAERELKKRGLLKYPAGHVNKYGEALSELDWARTQAGGLGPRFPYRGPSTEQRMDGLERQIRAFYPFAVKFNADSTAIVTLVRRGGGGSAVVEAPGGFRQEVAFDDQGKAQLTIPQPGFTRIKLGRKTYALITEPYTEIRADL